MKILSGGQTGADRAALDAAIDLGIEYGGSVPKGRLAEDGIIDPERYPRLAELRTASYPARTRKNVRDADATLALSAGELAGGTAQTVRYAKARGKPHLVVDLREQTQGDAARTVRHWLAGLRPAILNVAGPRESGSPGIYRKVLRVLNVILAGYPADGVDPLNYGIDIVQVGADTDNPLQFNATFNAIRAKGTYQAVLRFVATNLAVSQPLGCTDLPITFIVQ